MKPYEVLELAADYIDVHGWCQGQLRDASDHACAIGAMLVAGTGVPSSIAVDHPFSALLGAANLALARALSKNPDFFTVSEWNDTPGRTAAEVTSTMRACALTLRAQQTIDAPALESVNA